MLLLHTTYVVEFSSYMHTMFIRLQALQFTPRYVHIHCILYNAYIYMYTCLTTYTEDVTVKTFPKIGAFFCKGLSACMHIGPILCIPFVIIHPKWYTKNGRCN